MNIDLEQIKAAALNAMASARNYCRTATSSDAVAMRTAAMNFKSAVPPEVALEMVARIENLVHQVNERDESNAALLSKFGPDGYPLVKTADFDRRVNELLASNNALLERARIAESQHYDEHKKIRIEHAKKINKLAIRAEAAEARVERLRAALGPFADHSKRNSDFIGTESDFAVHVTGWKASEISRLTVRDFRIARAAMEETRK